MRKDLLFLIFTCWTVIALGQHVNVRFFNKTGSTLDSLLINDKQVPQLKHGETSVAIAFKEVLFKSRTPLLTGKCKLNNEWIYTEYLVNESAIINRITEGDYTFVLSTGFVGKQGSESKYLVLFINLTN